jgi:hypothetical protein
VSKVTIKLPLDVLPFATNIVVDAVGASVAECKDPDIASALVKLVNDAWIAERVKVAWATSRRDTTGRDVTNLPGLWDGSDSTG